MGFHENLAASDIFDQVRLTNERSLERFGRGVSNVVFMGMGEPLLNYDEVVKAVRLLTDDRLLNLSSKRITISTVGLAPRIVELADEDVPANLAVSLHAPTDEKRSSIMPVNRRRKTDLTALKEAIRYYAKVTGKIVTYEYCMFADFNDSLEDAANLASVAAWAPSKVNLIMYNQVDGMEFKRTTEEKLNQFVKTLVDHGIRVTVRRSRGQDIAAACGQLATANQQASADQHAIPSPEASQPDAS
jgi:23S rRNA (adenine2503-C2)-methyltransferase